MSLIERNGESYDVKINRLRIQPLFMINNSLTDIGLWDKTSTEETEKLLLKAIECYEYNKKNNTLIVNNSSINFSYSE